MDIIGEKDGQQFFVGGSTTSSPAPTTTTKKKTSSAVTAPVTDVTLATPKSLGLSFTPDPLDQTIDQATRALIASYGTKAPDAKQVRSSVLSQFQGEIDALDRAKAEAQASITRRYAQTEKEQTGVDTAIQARRGLLGSDFGASQTARVVGEVRGNRDQLIDDSDIKFETAKSSLMTQARTLANEEYNRKLEAYRAGSGATIQYLKDRQVAAQNNALKLVKQAYLSDIDLTDPGYALELKSLAQQIGVTPENLKQAFLDYKTAQDAAKAEILRKQLLEDREYNLDVEKENRERSRLNFDMSKFEQEFALNKQKTLAEIAKINNDIANGGANDTISDEFAAKYGLPLGTRKGDLAGFIPGQQENLSIAQTELDNRNEILTLVNELRNDAKGLVALDNSLGLNVPRNIKGTAQYNWKVKFDRLKAALSLNEAGKLKGSGAISDAERALLAQSASALDINSKDVTLAEFDRIEQKARMQAERLNNFIGTVNSSNLFNEFEGGSEGKDFFNGNQVKGTKDRAEKMELIEPGIESQGKIPYLKTLGAITGIDGSKYWKWGLDVDLKKGDKVKSPASGQIIDIKTAKETGGFGNQVRIRTSDGREIWLSHLDKLPPMSAKGQRIRAGQVLALGGNSGNTYSPGGGDGSHLDITMPKPGGGYYTAREVKAYLDNKYV